MITIFILIVVLVFAVMGIYGAITGDWRAFKGASSEDAEGSSDIGSPWISSDYSNPANIINTDED